MRGRRLPPAPRVGWGPFPRPTRTASPPNHTSPRAAPDAVKTLPARHPSTVLRRMRRFCRDPRSAFAYTRTSCSSSHHKALRPGLTSCKFFLDSVRRSPADPACVSQISARAQAHVCPRTSLGRGTRKQLRDAFVGESQSPVANATAALTSCPGVPLCS